MRTKIMGQILIFSLALVVPAIATDYYVSDNGEGTTCSVDFPCSLEYCVETKAVETNEIEDVVCYLNDGTYRTNSLQVPVGVSIVSVSLDKTRVTIEPNADSSYGPFIAFNSDTPGTSGNNQSLSHVTIDGRNGDHTFVQGIKVTNRDDVSIHNTTIRDFYGRTGWDGSYAVDASSDEAPRSNEWWLNLDGSFNRVDWPSVLLDNFQFYDNYVVNCGDGKPDRTFNSAIELWSVQNSTFQRNTINVSHTYTQAISGTSALLLNVDFIDNLLIGHNDGHFPKSKKSLSLYLIELWLIWDCDFVNNKTIRGQFSLAGGHNCNINNNFIDLRTSEAMSGYGIEATALDQSNVMHNKILGTINDWRGYGMHLGLGHAGHKYVLETRAWSNIIHNFNNDGVRITAVERIVDGICHGNKVTNATIFFHNNLVDNTAEQGGGYAGIFAQDNCNGNLTLHASNNIFTNNDLAITNAGGTPSISGSHNLFSDNITDTRGAMNFDHTKTSVPIFIDYTNDNFKMEKGSGVDAGIDLGEPYHLALNNNTDWTTALPTVNTIDRYTDAIWDLGPYEFGNGGSDITAPAPPTLLQVTN